MPLPKLTPQILAGLGVAIGLITGVTTTALVTSDGDKPSIEEVAARAPVEIPVDPREYQAAIMSAKHAAGPDSHLVDLLTGPVEPGAQVTTGVKIPLGARVTGGVSKLGEAAAFELDGFSFRDDEDWTWIEVTATNSAKKPLRFIAIFEYEPAAGP
jgi:hypothetical protein